MNGPVRNTVPPTTQGRFSIPGQLQSGRKHLAEKKMVVLREKKGIFGEEVWAVRQRTVSIILCKFAR